MSIEEDLKEIFRRFEHLQKKLGISVNHDNFEETHESIQGGGDSIEDNVVEKEKEYVPEIKKFSINSDYQSDIDSNEENLDNPDKELSGGKVKVKKLGSKKRKKGKLKKVKKKKSKKKSKNKFNIFMKKKLKELKKKHPKKTHKERFKMAASLYKKSK